VCPQYSDATLYLVLLKLSVETKKQENNNIMH
jgi:hypothetical protein